MVHEFIADKKAVEHKDSAALAAMILQAAYPQQYNSIINSFFNQSIKRRLHMLTKKQSPRLSYISRLLLIPTFALIILAFNLRTKDGNSSSYIESKGKASNDIKKENEATGAHKITAEKFGTEIIPDSKFIQAIPNSGNEQNEILTMPVLFTNDAETHVRSDIDFRKGMSVAADNAPQKNKLLSSADTIKPIFIKAEKEPEFPGGNVAWRNFLQKHLNASVPVDKGAPAGAYTVIIEFIVDEQGNISNLKSLTENGYGTEEEVLRIMQYSPNWTPAIQNGRNVSFLRKQPVTFVITDASDNQTTLTLTIKSGADISVSQLQSIPYSKLINPDTDTEIVSAMFEISNMDPKSDITTVKIMNKEPNTHIKKLLATARSGDIISIVKRKGKTKDGQIKDLPSIYYKIK
jgi:protein TonB